MLWKMRLDSCSCNGLSWDAAGSVNLEPPHRFVIKTEPGAGSLWNKDFAVIDFQRFVKQ